MTERASVDLLAGIATTRAIRRYHDEPFPKADLGEILFAATRAPTGSNRQPTRFVVLTDGPNAMAAKRLIGRAAQQLWAAKGEREGYGEGSGAIANSPKARMAATMQSYVDDFEKVPVLILPVLVRYRAPTTVEGASVYPACQNLLLAARALGYGGVLTGFHGTVDAELRTLLCIPDGAEIMATITLGRPLGSHGPVRRRPLRDVVFDDCWDVAADWAIDPPETRFAGGPPR